MSFWDLFRRRRYDDDGYDDEGLMMGVEDIEFADDSLERVDYVKLSSQDRNSYVEEQCEIIVECNNNIEEAKREYKTVSQYFADIQLIDGQPQEIRDRVTYLARSIAELKVDRKMLFGGEKKLSGSRYLQMKQEEDTIVDAIKKLKNQELYLQIIKKDISALNGEKESLKLDSKELVTRQSIIKSISIVLFLCFFILFSVLFIASLSVPKSAKENVYTTYCYVTLFFAALFAAGDVVLYRRTIYNTLVTEKKMNRAISLHNKVKIKYINVKNLIEYYYAKYGVKSSYELADLYQRYLETKAVKEKYEQATLEMSENEEELEGILIGIGLYDPEIWLSQIKALGEPKEMVEVRHAYSVRRQKLRKIIEENSNRAEEAKALLRDIIEKYPGYANEVLQVVDKYSD